MVNYNFLNPGIFRLAKMDRVTLLGCLVHAAGICFAIICQYIPRSQIDDLNFVSADTYNRL